MTAYPRQVEYMVVVYKARTEGQCWAADIQVLSPNRGLCHPRCLACKSLALMGYLDDFAGMSIRPKPPMSRFQG